MVYSPQNKPLKHKLSFLLLSLFIFAISCKTPTVYIPTIADLCNEIGPSKTIIGLGESTHGTKEFTIYRAEIVKELVENHGYRLFILEAEYITCSKINEYILTGKGDPETLLNKVGLWPWNNQDFLELIGWMRTYNTNHTEDLIQFFGMDVQYYSLYKQAVKLDILYYLEMYSYTTTDSIMKYYPIKGKGILEIENSADDPKTKMNNLLELSKTWMDEAGGIDLKLQYYLLTLNHAHAMSEPKDLNVRDENMAKLVEMIHANYQQKAIIWAHNGHVYRENDAELNYMTEGYHLAAIFGEQYGVIGMDFKEGTFKAISQDTADWQQMKTYQHKQLVETYASTVEYEQTPYKIVDCSSIKQRYYVNSIGALYKRNPDDVARYTSEVEGNSAFDYLFIIAESTPSELLGYYKEE